MKQPTIIAASDVPRKFSNNRVWFMAREAGYAPAKQPGFAEVVREAILELLENLARPTSNQVRHELDELVRVTLRATRERKRPGYWCEQVARLRDQMSPPAKKIMNRRGTLPDAAMLRDPATQRDACHAILGAGRLGTSQEEGRVRERDEQGNAIKRSMSTVSQVYGPKLQQRPPRHEPQMVLLERLENAHLRATSKLPSFTTNRARPNAFARFVQACLDAAGVKVSAIGLLEVRHWRRQKKTLHHLAERFDRAINEQERRWRAAGSPMS